MLLRRVTGTTAVRAIAALGSLAFTALVLNAYSLEKLGEFAFALVIVRVLAAMSLFSLDSLLLRLLFRVRRHRNSTVQVSVLKECTGLVEVLSIGTALCVAGIAAAGTKLADESDFWCSLWLLSPIIFVQNVATVQAALLRTQDRDFGAQLVLVGLPNTIPPLGLLAVSAHLDPTYLLPELLTVLGVVGGALIGFCLTGQRPTVNLWHGFKLLIDGRYRVLRYSAAVHSANVMNYFSDWYGSLLLAVTQSFEAVGVLRVLQQLGQAFQLVLVSIETPFSAEIAKAHIENRPRKLRALLTQSQLMLGGCGVVVLGLIFVGLPILEKIFDIDLAAYSVPLFAYLGLLNLRLFAGASASALNLMDTTRKLVRASSIALMASIILLSTLVPFFGIIGAAFALGGQSLVRAFVNYYFVRTELQRLEASQRADNPSERASQNSIETDLGQRDRR